MTDAGNLQSRLAQFLATNPSGETYDLPTGRTAETAYPEPAEDYYQRFAALDGYLNKKVHPFVNHSAAVQDPLHRLQTDHGSEHVATVIHRASQLCCRPHAVLSPYETYILLLGIHFHDIGNVFGRDGHEKRIAEVMGHSEVLAHLGADAIGRRLIIDIAMAHGGYADVTGQDKDTIGKIQYGDPTPGNPVRVRLLAAALRFADELAEDRSRASRFLLDMNVVPTPDEAYHLYADRLARVTIDTEGHAIELHFDLDRSHVFDPVGKDDDEVLLYDYIRDRLLKLHCEHIYCNRFLQPFVSIDQIKVKLGVYTNNYHTALASFAFKMEQAGYPRIEESRIVSQDLPNIDPPSGEALQHTIAARERDKSPTTTATVTQDAK